MMEEYMRQIKALIKKYKEETITEEEDLFLEYLMVGQLERIVMEEELSREEVELLEEWEREREFVKETEQLSVFNPEEIKPEAYASWQSFSRKLDISAPRELSPGIPRPSAPEEAPYRKHPVRRYITFAASAAAVIALLITLALPLFTGDGPGKPTAEKGVEAMILSRRVEAGDAIKKVSLTDGTVAWLNKGTTLSIYKGKINAHQREIWLEEGEAFFEVAKDPSRPFIVHTADGLSTQVLGTSFNIMAYRRLGEQVVSVKTGRVQVSAAAGQTLVLDPDYKASFNADDGTLTAGRASGEDAAAWRTGSVVLQDAGLDELALRLEQYYGVKLENRGNAINPNVSLSTSFAVNTPLEVTANRIARIYDIRYTVEEGRIIFYR